MKTVRNLSGSALDEDPPLHIHAGVAVQCASGPVPLQAQLGMHGVLVAGAQSRLFIPIGEIFKLAVQLDPTLNLKPNGLAKATHPLGGGRKQTRIVR